MLFANLARQMRGIAMVSSIQLGGGGDSNPPVG